MSSLLLLLLIIILLPSLSISSCEARHLRVHVKDLNTSLPHSSKDVAKMKLDEASSSMKPMKTSSKGSFADEIGVGATTEARTGRKDVDEKRGLVSGAVKKPATLRVSRRTPHQEHREHPGFHVDYVGPRTHPPSHN